MNLVDKLQEIVRIQNDNLDAKIGNFSKPINAQQIRQIEKLIGEPLPDDFITLYNFANGQDASGNGVLLGERFINSEEIARQLEISLSFVKPTNKKIDNKEKSDAFLQKIVDFYVDKTPRRNFLGAKKKWHKIEFKCGIDFYGGPYLYTNESATEEEPEIIHIDFKAYEKLSVTIREIHELEKESYNWDQLEFVVFSNGSYKVERTFYDFDNQIPFSSTPENAIKKKYFHYKWLPVFSDYGGNYIGIDLDPDLQGKKGQIINFGRDEEKMFVFAENLDKFFDFILTEMKKPGSKLLNSTYHLHDTLKELKY